MRHSCLRRNATANDTPRAAEADQDGRCDQSPGLARMRIHQQTVTDNLDAQPDDLDHLVAVGPALQGACDDAEYAQRERYCRKGLV